MIDKSRSKEHIQELLNKYKEICRREGEKGFRDMREAMGNLSAMGMEVTLEAQALAIAKKSRDFAEQLLETSEFYVLREYWAMKFNSSEREWAGVRLVDMGALEYSRAITGR